MFPSSFSICGTIKIKKQKELSSWRNPWSEILTIFYPLAGRYKEHLLIDCNDHGVEFLEAKVDSHVLPFLDRNVDSKQLIHLIPYQTESATSPLLAVQCNIFDCRGLVFGLCNSHRIIDATLLSEFVDGWTKASRIGLHGVDIRPIFDVSSILPPIDIVQGNRFVLPIKPGLKTASKTFVFDRLALSDLRKKANNKGSRVQLVTAVKWKALIRIAESKYGMLRPSIVSHFLNLRGRTLRPILDDSCGNLFRPVIIRFFLKNYRNFHFEDLVYLISDAITKTINDCANLEKADDLCLIVNNAWREINEELEKEVDTYCFRSTCGMPFYPNFGWGKPVQVTHVQSEVEMIALMDTKDGDGIEERIC